MYKSEGFTSKDLAEAKRLLIISERDAGKFKFDYLQQYSQMPSSKVDRKKAKKLQQKLLWLLCWLLQSKVPWRRN